MAYLQNGYLAASIYDPATGVTVQMNHLGLGTSYTPAVITTDTTSSRVYGGESHELVLEFFDAALNAQLRTWMINRTPVRVVVAGVGKSIQWYESEPVRFQQMPESDKRTGLNKFQAYLSHEGGADAAIYNNANLLAYLGWADANTDNLADGYVAANATADSFTSDVQTLTATSSDGRLARTLIFPISGIKLTSSFNITNTATNQLLVWRDYNYSISLLASNTTTVSSTGLKSKTGTTSSGIYQIQVEPLFVTSVGADAIMAGKFPELTVGTEPKGNGNSFFNQ